jgi:hypothetical protein
MYPTDFAILQDNASNYFFTHHHVVWFRNLPFTVSVIRATPFHARKQPEHPGRYLAWRHRGSNSRNAQVLAIPADSDPSFCGRADGHLRRLAAPPRSAWLPSVVPSHGG